MDLKQLFLTRSHDGYLGKEDNVSNSKYILYYCFTMLVVYNFINNLYQI